MKYLLKNAENVLTYRRDITLSHGKRKLEKSVILDFVSTLVRFAGHSALVLFARLDPTEVIDQLSINRIAIGSDRITR